MGKRLSKKEKIAIERLCEAQYAISIAATETERADAAEEYHNAYGEFVRATIKMNMSEMAMRADERADRASERAARAARRG